ncbi:MAG: hypothetical protein V7751_22915, partial [Pseudoalteromonas distincta]
LTNPIYPLKPATYDPYRQLPAPTSDKNRAISRLVQQKSLAKQSIQTLCFAHQAYYTVFNKPH